MQQLIAQIEGDEDWLFSPEIFSDGAMGCCAHAKHCVLRGKFCSTACSAKIRNSIWNIKIIEGFHMYQVNLCLLPTGGSPAAAWAGTASVCGWPPRGGSLSGPAPSCRRFAVHQNSAGSSGPPLALWPQSQNTTITLTDVIPPINSLKYGCTLL